MTERRRYLKQEENSLAERLADRAKNFRAEAELLPAGKTREGLLMRASQAEDGARMSEWLSLRREPSEYK